VPRLIGWAVGSLIIGVSIVRPPYVLDFARSDLDTPTDFPAEAMQQWL
jgi:hypothetical protein